MYDDLIFKWGQCGDKRGIVMAYRIINDDVDLCVYHYVYDENGMTDHVERMWVKVDDFEVDPPYPIEDDIFDDDDLL